MGENIKLLELYLLLPLCRRYPCLCAVWRLRTGALAPVVVMENNLKIVLLPVGFLKRLLKGFKSNARDLMAC